MVHGVLVLRLLKKTLFLCVFPLNSLFYPLYLGNTYITQPFQQESTLHPHKVFNYEYYVLYMQIFEKGKNGA